jgi:hypothetical protein
MEELHQQLIGREDELTRLEEAFTVWEKSVKVSERALVKVSLDLDTEPAKTEATRQEYLNKMRAHTTHTKHTLSLENMLVRRRSCSLRRSRTSR